MHLECRLCETVPKSSRLEDNEDIIGLPASTNNITRVALCDGASESYNSKALAEILKRRWMDGRIKIPSLGLKGILEDFNKEVDKSKLGWAQAAAFERGSFSTFLGLEFIQNTLRIFAIGDTMACVIEKAPYGIKFYPYNNLSEVPKKPILLSSIRKDNSFYKPSILKGKHYSIIPKEGTHIFLMTDALALWTLKKPKKNIKILFSIRNTADFERFVESERFKNRIKDDDTTFIHLQVIS
jgi:hypothetical protein